MNQTGKSIQPTEATIVNGNKRPFNLNKEITLERADLTLQLLMFLTAEKEGQMYIFSFYPVFSAVVPAILS